MKEMEVKDMDMLKRELDEHRRLQRKAEEIKWDSFDKENIFLSARLFKNSGYVSPIAFERPVSFYRDVHVLASIYISSVISKDVKFMKLPDYYISFPEMTVTVSRSFFIDYKGNLSSIMPSHAEFIPQESKAILDKHISVDREYLFGADKPTSPAKNIIYLPEDTRNFKWVPFRDRRVGNFNLAFKYALYYIRSSGRLLFESHGLVIFDDWDFSTGKTQAFEYEFVSYATCLVGHPDVVIEKVTIDEPFHSQNFDFEYDVDTWRAKG